MMCYLVTKEINPSLILLKRCVSKQQGYHYQEGVSVSVCRSALIDKLTCDD